MPVISTESCEYSRALLCRRRRERGLHALDLVQAWLIDQVGEVAAADAPVAVAPHGGEEATLVLAPGEEVAADLREVGEVRLEIGEARSSSTGGGVRSCASSPGLWNTISGRGRGSKMSLSG